MFQGGRVGRVSVCSGSSRSDHLPKGVRAASQLRSAFEVQSRHSFCYYPLRRHVGCRRPFLQLLLGSVYCNLCALLVVAVLGILLHRLTVENKSSVAPRNHTSPVAPLHSVSAVPLSVEGVALSIHDDVVLAPFASSVFNGESRHDERSMKCDLRPGIYTP